MGFFRDLFSKPITSKELKVALKGLERQKHQLQLDLKKLSARQNQLIDQAKIARNQHRNDEIDWIWQEMKHLKMEIALQRKQIKILNLESIGLKRYIWGLERLERENNKDGIRNLLSKIRRSKLDVKLAVHDIKEKEYLEELEMTLENLTSDMELEEEFNNNDPRKEKFLQEIDGILAAEKSGDLNAAKEREERLKLNLDYLPSEQEDPLLHEEEEEKPLET